MKEPVIPPGQKRPCGPKVVGYEAFMEKPRLAIEFQQAITVLNDPLRRGNLRGNKSQLGFQYGEQTQRADVGSPELIGRVPTMLTVKM